MQRFIFLFVAVLVLRPAAASGQSVRGVVLDEATSQPVAGAMVTLLVRGTPLTSARSDSAGAFMLFPRRTGSYIVQVTHAFYASVDSVPLTLDSGETVELEVRLGRQAVPLDPIVVTARSEARLAGFHERMRQPSRGQYVTRDQIDARPGARTTDLLRELPGVVVTSVGRGGADQPTAFGTPDPTAPRATRLAMRGNAGLCLPAIYVDGMQVRQWEDTSIDDFIRPEMLEGVEAYPDNSGAPPGMIDPGHCGVIAFWTRGPLEGSRWSWTRAALGTAAFALLVALTR
jgi:hypothetical protein